MAGERAIVVGAGSISNYWFPPLKEENVQIVAVVDLRKDAAQAAIKKYELTAQAYDSLLPAIRKHKPDFVVDLTVPEAHSQVTCAALRAGCNVIGEKPMASSMAQARRMVQAAEKSGKLYMVSQSRRMLKLYDSVRRTIAAGKIGQVTAINCDFYMGAHFGGFRDEMPSPLLLDMAIHHMDLCRFMAGVDPLAVYAKEFNPKGSWYKGDVAASCIFEMSSGVVFTYRGSWCAEGCHTSWNGDWRITGERGTLIVDHDRQPYGQVIAGDEGFHRKLADLEILPPILEYENMHGALREMLAYLRTGAMPQTHCHDNIKSLAMVFAAIASSHRGACVPVRI